MSRVILVAIPVVCGLVALIGTAAPAAVAVISGGLVGLGLSWSLWAVERAQLTRLARAVNEWVGIRRREPVQVPSSAAWEQLAISLNALGAAYERRASRLSRARWLRKQLVDALPVAALLFDEEGYLVRANPEALERFEIPDGSRTVAQTFGSPRISEAVTEARESGQAVAVILELGPRNEVAVLAAPVGDEVLVVVTDRTARRRVDAVRRDFVANASHELKTPVSGIGALADALEVTVGHDPERAGHLVRRLQDEAGRLGKLVHDLLDLRRLEETRHVDPARVDLAAVVRDEVRRVRHLAAERDIEIEVALPQSASLAGVEDDLRIVVANLLDNALGYNEPGGTVRVELEPLDGAHRLRVSDTGIGIARKDIDRIFERFYRVDVARSRESGGTGLGLALVRHAVERHGGSVSVDSILGEGSTFTVTLPVDRD